MPEPEHKRAANLSLSPSRLAFGHRYAEAHHTSLSQVVNDLLEALENSVTLKASQPGQDPLDGLLAGWPDLDKSDLRKGQHQKRLGR
jgi:hypothetical protein